jgi:hypothetical protein
MFYNKQIQHLEDHDILEDMAVDDLDNVEDDDEMELMDNH